MAVTPAGILDSARGTLLDAAATAWSQADLLKYLNEAMEATALVKPDFYTKDQNVEMAEGSEQVLPDDGLQTFDLRFNAYSGEVVTLVDRELLDETNRFWPITDRQRDVQHFSVDVRDPKRFSVSPPNDGTGEVRALYGALPPEVEIGEIGEPLSVSAKFEPILISYVLHRAYMKNSKRQDLTKAAFHKQQWAADLGLGTRSQIANTPKATPQENKP